MRVLVSDCNEAFIIPDNLSDTQALDAIEEKVSEVDDIYEVVERGTNYIIVLHPETGDEIEYKILPIMDIKEWKEFKL